MSEINEDDREMIEILREEHKDRLSKKYDTDFNILRWIIGYNRDLNKASEALGRHLKHRQLLNFDNIADWKFDNPAITQYTPIGYLGPTGLNDNKFVIIESIGRSDPYGLTHAIAPREFAHARLQLLDRALTDMNAAEAESGKQSSVVYIYDMEKLEFDPYLMSVVLGPIKLLWIYISVHYPELIDTIIVINAPSFFNILFKAVSPFLPARTASKTIIASENWQEILREHVHPDVLPVYWGGNAVDSNGDTMCRNMIVIPPGKVPEELYWKPKLGEPGVKDLTPINVPAGGFVLLSTRIKGTGVFLDFYMHSDTEYTFGIYYSKRDVDQSVTIDELEEYLPGAENPAMISIDHYRIPINKNGVYHLKLGNEKAWLKSVTVNYQLTFSDKDKTVIKDRKMVKQLNY